MGHWNCAWVSHIGDKAGNEDAAWAEAIRLRDGTRIQAVCVADGVSGGRNGAEVAQMAVKAAYRALKGARGSDLATKASAATWSQRWGAALQEEVCRTYPNGFCTLCLVVRAGGHLLTFHVGDSLAYFLKDDGTVDLLLEYPHTVAHSMIISQQEERPDLRFYKILDRAVGKECAAGVPLMDVYFHPLGDHKGWVVAGSDGVFDYIYGSELRRCLENLRARGQAQADTLADCLVRYALAAGRARGDLLDNATVAVFGIRQKRTYSPRTLGIQLVGGLLAVLLGCFGLLVYQYLRSQERLPPAPKPPPVASVVPAAIVPSGQPVPANVFIDALDEISVTVKWTDTGGANSSKPLSLRYRGELVRLLIGRKEPIGDTVELGEVSGSVDIVLETKEHGILKRDLNLTEAAKDLTTVETIELVEP